MRLEELKENVSFKVGPTVAAKYQSRGVDHYRYWRHLTVSVPFSFKKKHFKIKSKSDEWTLTEFVQWSAIYAEKIGIFAKFMQMRTGNLHNCQLIFLNIFFRTRAVPKWVKIRINWFVLWKNWNQRNFFVKFGHFGELPFCEQFSKANEPKKWIRATWEILCWSSCSSAAPVQVYQHPLHRLLCWARGCKWHLLVFLWIGLILLPKITGKFRKYILKSLGCVT